MGQTLSEPVVEKVRVACSSQDLLPPLACLQIRPRTACLLSCALTFLDR